MEEEKRGSREGEEKKVEEEGVERGRGWRKRRVEEGGEAER